MKSAFYILAFIEGALVMAYELVVSRLLAPHFGGSLYVITSVLGVTMISLFLGYLLGGILSKKNVDNQGFLFTITASFYLIALQYVKHNVIYFSIEYGLIVGSVVSAFILLGIPLIILGAVGPQLINAIDRTNHNAGFSSGSIYAISTFGGVCATFIVGLFLIPSYGIDKSCLIIGGISLLAALTTIVLTKSKVNFRILLLISISILSLSFSQTRVQTKNNVKVLHSEEGMLGTVEVLDIDQNKRVLSNNGTYQTLIDKNTGVSIFYYSHVIATAASYIQKNKRKNALLIGMAGGSLINELYELKFSNITAVDIDKRTKEIAEKYFYLDPAKYNFIEDDGRHYLSTTNSKFDLIIIDVSASEEQPFHLYTKDAFEVYKSKLNDSGLIILNILDFTDNRKLKITNSIGDAILDAGMEVKLLKDFYPHQNLIPTQMEYYAHEKVLISYKKGFDFDNSDTKNEPLNACCHKYNFCHKLKSDINEFSFTKNQNTSDGYQDDCPRMDADNFERTMILRNNFFKN